MKYYLEDYFDWSFPLVFPSCKAQVGIYCRHLAIYMIRSVSLKLICSHEIVQVEPINTYRY